MGGIAKVGFVGMIRVAKCIHLFYDSSYCSQRGNFLTVNVCYEWMLYYIIQGYDKVTHKIQKTYSINF
jgi:hypothetical protein